MGTLHVLVCPNFNEYASILPLTGQISHQNNQKTTLNKVVWFLTLSSNLFP
jgi:hypothetical protein